MGAGAALVPLNTRFKGPEAAYVLTRSRAKALFTVRGFLGIDYPETLENEDSVARFAREARAAVKIKSVTNVVMTSFDRTSGRAFRCRWSGCASGIAAGILWPRNGP